ncbi:MAG: CoA transferase [Acidobacteria bacterium]|nr:MAG: CoA transferase [Acidobacteriota bacterium]REK11077.1 MAG: CoA transferase [Acidobacteriota bacterium]
MPGPLDGIRVLDLTAIVSGPLATMMLAEQGADVIKVEPPTVGDLTRPMGTQRGGVSAIFAAANRSKRCIVLDLSQPPGLEAFRDLVPTADVLVQNFRPGAAERMGIGYAAMAALNPDLVYCSIAGFGRSGPHAGRRVYDPLIQAASGMAWAQGQSPQRRMQAASEAEAGGDAPLDRPGEAPPDLVRSIVCDKVTALTAAQAITAALFARERGAGGQHVELSMLDAAIAFHWCDMMWNHSFLPPRGLADRDEDPGLTRTPDLADMFRISRASDGYVLVVSGSDVEFRGVCNAFGRPELADDPRFATLLGRMQAIDEIRDWEEREIARRSADEVCALLDEHGVPCAKVNRLAELAGDDQARHNETIERVEHPRGGAMLRARPPARFEKTPSGIRCHAADHGEHTEEVLAEAGFDAERIAALRAAGVLGPTGAAATPGADG